MSVSKAIRWPDKDPDETAAYAVTFVDRLAAGATLSGATWSVLPATTPALTFSGAAQAGAIASIKVVGGLDGTKYDVLCRVTTSDVQTLDQTITVRCRGR